MKENTKTDGVIPNGLPAVENIEKTAKEMKQSRFSKDKSLTQNRNENCSSNTKKPKNSQKNRNNQNNNDKKKVQINKSHFSRINYLYQISRLSIISDDNASNNKNIVSNTVSQISRMYIKNMDSISKKTTSKIHPRLKRNICKNCQAVLIDGISKSVRLENYNNSRIGNLVIRCSNCEQVVKRFPLKIGEIDEFVPRSERDETLLSVD